MSEKYAKDLWVGDRIYGGRYAVVSVDRDPTNDTLIWVTLRNRETMEIVKTLWEGDEPVPA